MTMNRSHLSNRTAGDDAALSDINDAYDAINDLKDTAADRTDGKFTSSNLEIDTDATSAGDRGIKFWLTASTWVRYVWDNTSALFKLVDQAGALQKLSIADGTSSTHATTKGQLDTAINALQLEVTGAMKLYGGSSAPTGYLWCDGAAVSRSTYAALFAIVGTTFGAGNGSTTFNVPDLRGRVPLGKDNMGGSTASRVTSASTGGSNATTLGGTGGAETHALTSSENGPHTHTIGVSGGGSNASIINQTPGTNPSGTYTSSSSGSGTAHNNTQPWLAVNYIIKT